MLVQNTNGSMEYCDCADYCPTLMESRQLNSRPDDAGPKSKTGANTKSYYLASWYYSRQFMDAQDKKPYIQDRSFLANEQYCSKMEPDMTFYWSLWSNNKTEEMHLKCTCTFSVALPNIQPNNRKRAAYLVRMSMFVCFQRQPACSATRQLICVPWLLISHCCFLLWFYFICFCPCFGALF